MIAALFTETDGAYYGLPNVDPWDEDRDARFYRGPHRVIAHPPCDRWGRYWHGSPRKPHQYRFASDGGCFAAALSAVRDWGGILEHPKDSYAWQFFGLNEPPFGGGWIKADDRGGLTCCVEQGFYGHFARKPTWLYAYGIEVPELRWGRSPQRIDPIALERYGYKKARRCGVIALIGGKDRKRIRGATPAKFRDLLLSMVGQVARPKLRAIRQASLVETGVLRRFSQARQVGLARPNCAIGRPSARVRP